MTKDFGENWTHVGLITLPATGTGAAAYQPALPTNDISQEQYPIDIQNFGNISISRWSPTALTPTSSIWEALEATTTPAAPA